ncbi:unnamed protein product [Rhizophagus irregularis]|nr:unnamed protein product [Rhizophagus irregularis]
MYRREQYIPSIYDNPNNNYNQSKYGESNQEWDDPNNDHDDQSQGWDGQSHNSPSVSCTHPTVRTIIKMTSQI